MFEFLKKAKKDPKEELKKTLGSYELPSFPGVILEGLEKIRDPASSSNAIALTLSSDPGLTVKILAMVNSAAYGMQRKIKSLDQAIAILGVSTIESLVLGIAVTGVLPKRDTEGFNNDRFWKTSARRAVTARALSMKIHPAQASESFTAALLQDMAIPILSEKMGKTYSDLLLQWHNGAEDLTNLEQSVYAWDHAEVATWICSEWSLPENLALSINGHHGSRKDDEELYCLPTVLMVSNLKELDEQKGIDQLVSVAEEVHSIPSDDTIALVEKAFEDAEQLIRLFS
jgi:HD-like signal output (HDOD) protein